ncbi:hypothetical protein WJX75_009271 [Coccomyxa subellipsoidea]|uniref:Coenzyme Q-binding protein COQ10 START domain-containing protein n=1 Tax=Coccomyxa subellipsoidea TaxID=248742 RepID=A0ABR2YCI2_9CHLO
MVRASAAGSVAVTVEPAGKNAQCLYAGVDISAPVDVIWGALTDYDGLGTFIPGLAENRCLERRAQGAQLLQIGEQEIAFGAKFRARVVLDIQEYWSGVPGNNRNGNRRSNGGGWFGGRSAAEEQHIEPRSPLPTQPHDIAFCASEGDFQVFRGVWRIQEGPRGGDSSRLSYALFVRPQIWLPVRLVQGRIESEIKNNLAAVRSHTERLYSQKRAGLRK